jgi:hypothetical protein
MLAMSLNKHICELCGVALVYEEKYKQYRDDGFTHHKFILSLVKSIECCKDCTAEKLVRTCKDNICGYEFK